MDQLVAEGVVRSALCAAINDTYLCDRVLFDDRTNERSILFHIGRRLVPLVGAFGDRWSVDLEYNRWHEHELAIVRTKLLGLRPGSPLKRVYPDLVVHDRSGSYPDCNLLVVEAKHAPRPADRLFDHRKLVAFQQTFGYQHAVFLEFPGHGGSPRWCWVPRDAQWDADFYGPEWTSQPVT